MTLNVHRYDGLIIPDLIPGDDLHPNSLDDVAQTLRTAGGDAVTHADTASTIWAGMPAVLESPQGAVIYSALGSPDTELRTLSGKFDRVANALETFASAVRPLIKTFAAIKVDAIKLTDEIGYDGLVWVSPQETKAYEWDSKATVGGSRAAVRTATEVVDYLHSLGESAHVRGRGVVMLAPWTESSEHIDRNNGLMDRVADAYTKLQNAEADCANAINRERNLCVADVEKIEAWQLKQSGDNTAVLPWGHRVDENRNCGESAWWGVGNVGKETLEGLGTLIGLDSLTGKWSWETAGKGWLGVATGLGSLVLMTIPPAQILGQLGVPVFKEALNNTTEMGKGLLAWDVWAKNPAEAGGRVAANLLTFLIPGPGEIAGAIKGITGAAHVAEVASDAARLSEAAGVGVSKADGLVTKLEGLSGDVVGTGVKIEEVVTVGSKIEMPDGSLLHVEAPHIEAPHVQGPHVDGPTIHTPHVDTPHIEAPHHIDTPQIPEPHIGDPLPTHPDVPHGDPADPTPHGGDGPGGNVPDHTGLSEPPAHAGPDGTPLSSVDWTAIDAEFRPPEGGFVDPARLDEWAQKVSDAYPTLSPTDAKAIYDYTTDAGYQPMNEYLRYGTIDGGHIPTANEVASIESRISATTEALSKLPSAPGYVTRGVGITQDFLDQFVEGKPWHDNGFASSTLSPQVTHEFVERAVAEGKQPGIMEIYGQTGTVVRPISAFQAEAEILFQRGTEFDVISKFADADGVWHIVLREVAP
ncbi:MAG: ADP-ribosyltransferase [Pseudolysinimonas sp.]|uniref:ADP-ribosyltransferase n=1 Tax=Pseudolysinimonas sp. TaxID=2680009 RepID=UPI0032665010